MISCTFPKALVFEDERFEYRISVKYKNPRIRQILIRGFFILHRANGKVLRTLHGAAGTPQRS